MGDCHLIGARSAVSGVYTIIFFFAQRCLGRNYWNVQWAMGGKGRKRGDAPIKGDCARQCPVMKADERVLFFCSMLLG